MNSVNLVGNLANDIELKKTQNNLSVCSFSVAVRRNFKNEKGEYDSDFINCIAWKQSADFLHQYAKKGNKLAIDGRLQARSYESQDGRKVYVTEVVCDTVEIVHQKNDDAKVEQKKPEPQPKVDNQVVIDSDDLPFY